MRDALVSYMLENRIRMEIHYSVVTNAQRAMKEILEGRYCSVADGMYRTTLVLPISFRASRHDAGMVVEYVNRFMKQRAA
jgi:dTDP-4-amino-4,6-dideoxygalactose transaminase